MLQDQNETADLLVLSSPQAGKRLGLSEAKMRQMRLDGTGPAFVVLTSNRVTAHVFMNVQPSRAALRRVAKQQAAVDRVTDGDRRFFDRHPGRTYRVRLASAAEVETAGAVLDADTAPVPGGRWVMLIRKLAGDVRLRVLAQAHAWMAGDLDLVGDDEAGRAYRHVCRPGTAAFRVEREAIATLQAAGAIK